MTERAHALGSDNQGLDPQLCASLALQRGVDGAPIGPIRQWVLAACAEVTVLPPPSVIADVVSCIWDMYSSCQPADNKTAIFGK